VIAAVQARRRALLATLGRVGFAQQSQLTDQQCRMKDIKSQVVSVKARALEATAASSDAVCVAAYADVLSTLESLPAAAVGGRVLEAPAVSGTFEAKMDVAPALMAVNRMGEVLDDVKPQVIIFLLSFLCHFFAYFCLFLSCYCYFFVCVCLFVLFV